METEDRLNELDLLKIFEKIFKNKLLIIILTSIFALSSVYYALSLKNYYISSSILSVDQKGSKSGGIGSLGSSYGGLAALAGISLPSGGADSSAYAVNLIESREFLKHLLTFEKVLPSIMAPENFDQNTNLLTFNKKLYNKEEEKWVRRVSNPKKVIPSHLETYKTYMEALSVKVDKKTGFLSISVEHISPNFANELLVLIISEANKLSKNKDMAETSSALEYLYEEYSKESYSEIKTSISKLIDSQLEKKMFANVKDDYLISIIDPPFIPEEKSRPGRAKICIFLTFFGFLFSIFIVLIKEFLIIKKFQNT